MNSRRGIWKDKTMKPFINRAIWNGDMVALLIIYITISPRFITFINPCLNKFYNNKQEGEYNEA